MDKAIKITVEIGGVPMLDEIIGESKESKNINTNLNTNTIGLRKYGEVGESKVGEYFEEKLMDAGDKDSYQYSLNTANEILADNKLDDKMILTRLEFIKDELLEMKTLIK